MLVFKNKKMIECTQEDFTRIECIYKNATSLIDATEKLYYFLVLNKIAYKMEKRTVTTTDLKDMAYNAVSAVANKYKYLKIKE